MADTSTPTTNGHVPRSRATAAEKAAREQQALELLLAGHSPALVSHQLQQDHGISARTARDYLREARLLLLDQQNASPDDLGFVAVQSIISLQRIATRHESDNPKVAIQAHSRIADAVSKLLPANNPRGSRISKSALMF